MRKTFLLLVLMTVCSGLFGFEWQSIEVVDELREKTQYPIQACAICTDKADMAKVARIRNLDEHFYTVETLAQDQKVEEDVYVVLYCVQCYDYPKIIGLIYRKEGVCEVYFIY